ncbi:hypothetical protein ABEV00_06540 [Paenibacillus thiaminolyticus]|uniref:hypothetical protein n=1 Tax=Paenibacillus TaxID=44249 RepID=UPI00105A3DC2|nr:hypothetical protein [Paenibacillus dendritiformis]TDL54261.1 hypothetical protein E2R60_14710 [Paenibacillus dendritiformis]
MKNEKKLQLIVILYLFGVAVLGRFIFMIPDKQYLNILNINDFYVTSCALLLIITLFIFLVTKASIRKKTLSSIVASLIIFTCFTVYFYSNLPTYTYELAVKKVEEAEKHANKNVQIQIPIYREDKLGVTKASFLSMTNYMYYVYLKVDGMPVAYKFNPMDGQYEKLPGGKELADYTVQ